MTNKTNSIDARQELADLVKRKAEIGVSMVQNTYFFCVLQSNIKWSFLPLETTLINLIY